MLTLMRNLQQLDYYDYCNLFQISCLQSYIYGCDCDCVSANNNPNHYDKMKKNIQLQK